MKDLRDLKREIKDLNAQVEDDENTIKALEMKVMCYERLERHYFAQIHDLKEELKRYKEEVASLRERSFDREFYQ